MRGDRMPICSMAVVEGGWHASHCRMMNKPRLSGICADLTGFHGADQPAIGAATRPSGFSSVWRKHPPSQYDTFLPLRWSDTGVALI